MIFEENRAYTIPEVALILKVNPFTIRRWINKGKIEAFRIGKLMRVDGSKLNEYLKQYKVNDFN